MKKFLKYLGIGIFSVVIFLAVIIALTTYLSKDLEEVFVPYIQETVPELATWKPSAYEAAMSEEGFRAVTKEQWKLYLKTFSKLGSLRSVGIPELQKSSVASTVRTGTTTYAVYLVPLEFDTGAAHVQLGLQHNSDKVEINSVRFLSDLLLQ